jgi:hypothetical protein
MKTKTFTVALLLLAASCSAQAQPSLPQELWGKWCATGSVTSGGSPWFWYYSRTCESDRSERLTNQDMTLGPHHMDSCRSITLIEWMQNNAPQYIVTYRCKDGSTYASMFDLDKEGNLTAQYHQTTKEERPIEAITLDCLGGLLPCILYKSPGRCLPTGPCNALSNRSSARREPQAVPVPVTRR